MTLDFLGTLQRTHMCGDLRSSNSGETVTLMGWVNRRRDHGNLIFLDLRDRTGITQVVLDKEASPLGHAKAEAARPEYVVAVTGKVRTRGTGLANPNMPTGEIELVGHNVLLLNDAKTPPFPIADDSIAVNEESRLKYRYLDLRRPELQRNFVLRHNITRAIREYLSDNGFLEIETPLLTRSTPEGARDYLVPSRVHPGHFYALPQSPQIFKQLLMVSGFDRYFQIARCFRDEDLRADRQPDFTQIDLEISFPQMSTIFATAEGFLRAAFSAAGITLPDAPFIQMTYDQAIQRYGIDKPDMRLPAMVDVTSAFTPQERAELKLSPNHPVLAVVIPEGENHSTMDPPLSGTQKKKFREELIQSIGGKPVAQIDLDRLRKAPQYSPLYQRIDALCGRELGAQRCEPESQMFVFNALIDAPDFWGNDRQWFYKLIGQLRLEISKKLSGFHQRFLPTTDASIHGGELFRIGDKPLQTMAPELVGKAFKFLWVTDFPMYEWNEETRTWDAAHHPFTSPHEEDIQSGALVNDKGSVRALAYDVVLNGTELGSGSIRIHRKDVQAEIFRSLGMDEAEQKARFGFFLDALEYGTPPHGGIALGLDRIAMILSGASSLREVIAFPKTAKAIDLMVEAPTTVSDIQLRDLHLKVAARN